MNLRTAQFVAARYDIRNVELSFAHHGWTTVADRG
jgi:hypothetical protein